ncbi:hypothetical protein FI667_g3577, partial [Globisporangium splendens]
MDIHNVVRVAREHAVDADNAATHASADTPVATVDQSDGDETLFKRKYDELDKLFIETQQDRQELARCYAVVQKQLERVHMENDCQKTNGDVTLYCGMRGMGARYLMVELSRYAPSDLESDQSDIELHYTPHTRRSLLPSPTTAESDAVVSSKAKAKSYSVVKADGTPTKDAAAKPKRRRAPTSTAVVSASSTVPKKLSAKTKKPKKTTE